MVKFLMNGNSGFIGGLVRSQLSDDFLATGDWEGQSGVVFLNLANISSNVAASMALMHRNFEVFGSRIKHWIHVCSFSSLQKFEELNPCSFNFGARAPLRDAYIQGKLAQEYFLVEQLKRGAIDGLTFFYLPAVIDPGGSWERTIQRARVSGYILPRMCPNARFNHIAVQDFTSSLTSFIQMPGLRRFIVNRSESAQTPWQLAFGPNEIDPRSLSYVDRVGSLRRILTADLLARARGMTPVNYEGNLKTDLPQRSKLEDNRLDDSVLQFYGVMRWLVRFQPYIAPR